MKICVGIISYLPDSKIRSIRWERLSYLIYKCGLLFNLPIIIVAQNWKTEAITYPLASVYKYDKLGITEARRELRKLFLESDYDYLIMLDDDSELIGDISGANEYLRQIEAHPAMYGVFHKNLLKLFAISKTVYSKVDFPNKSVENGDFLEDLWLITYLEKVYPELAFNFNAVGLSERSDSRHDAYSTWYSGQIDKLKSGDKTRKLLEEV